MNHYNTTREAAEAFGWKHNTYKSHENGERGIRPDAAKRYAKAFKSTAEYILFGKNEKESMANKLQLEKGALNITIQELDVRAGAGAGALVDDVYEVLAEWSLPKEYVAPMIKSGEGVFFIQVQGDSMVPEFQPGQRVMVNTKDRNPTPPGVFVIWDGFGLVMKRCEMVPYSDPATVKLSSVNPSYPPYQLNAADVHICGRVVGKWEWT